MWVNGVLITNDSVQQPLFKTVILKGDDIGPWEGIVESQGGDFKCELLRTKNCNLKIIYYVKLAPRTKYLLIAKAINFHYIGETLTIPALRQVYKLY